MTPLSVIRPQPPSAEEMAGADRSRLRAYLACLLVAFGLYLLVHGFGQGAAFLFICVVVLVVMVLSLFLPSSRHGRIVVTATTIAAGVIALFVPLAGVVSSGKSLPAAINESTVWPQVLVTLFAGRLLAELCELRFVAFWRRPFEAGGRVATQSMAAAFFFGCCLTLIFYQIVGGIAPTPERLDPWAIAIRAFAGQTAIHVAIVLLFFVVLAAIVDAILLLVNDGLALAALRRLCRAREVELGILTKRDLAELTSSQLSPFAHTRTVRFIQDALHGDQSRGGGRSLTVFHGASRRLIRALISFLPLMGFLGTVIGLTAAIGGLPDDLGPGAQGEIDISASLLGLAVKFETTLLGLTGGLATSLLLSLLEKREEELGAECRRLVEASADAA